MNKTHNKLFIENLLNELYKNIDYYLEKSFQNNDTYILFMNELANNIYKNYKLSEINLPITGIRVDFKKVQDM